MPTPDEFRQLLRNSTIDDIVSSVLLAGDAAHVDHGGHDYICQALGATFGAPVERQQVVVVGSAKLGFSISEKRTFGGVGLERYRPFRPESDIDIALVHPFIFDQLWRELSDHSHRSPTMPRDSARLGDYLVYGWIRPDHFPKNVRLRRCDDWWDTFNKMTAEGPFNRRKVRGGLFHSTYYLASYLRRAVNQCLKAEEIAQ
jgi:hypothetical protein